MKGWKSREMIASAKEKRKASRAEIRRIRATHMGQVAPDSQPVEEPQSIIDEIVEEVEAVADEELATVEPEIEQFEDDLVEEPDPDDSIDYAQAIVDMGGKVDGRWSDDRVKAEYFELANSDATEADE